MIYRCFIFLSFMVFSIPLFAHEKYALEYGPVLMALVGLGNPDFSYILYWELEDEAFTCFPVIHF